MNFRTTTFAASNQSLKFASQYNTNIVKYQQQITSGLRIHRPSDDPVSFRQVTSLRVRLQELNSESFSIVDSEAKLNTSVSQLTEANTLLVKAKSLAQQGIQATTESERVALAIEVEGILGGLQHISQIKTAGSYLYSGTKTDQIPFTFDNPTVEGGTLNVDYQGGSENSRAYIGDAISIDTFFAGDRIFGGANRSESIITGNTGAKLGVGTDTMVGRSTLQVRHGTTTLAAGSGVVAGASSADQDTLIGAFGDNSLVIQDTSGTGASGTVSLNGGEPVAWTSGDTDLKVFENNGREIHLDFSSVTPGFNGPVDVESTGTVSVDGGATEVALDFSDSQTIVDSTTGTQVHVDTTGVSQTGDDYLEFPGTSDVFQALYELKEDLRNTRGLDNQARAQSLDRRIGEIERLSEHVLEAVGRQAASLQVLDDLEFRVQDLQLDVETQLSELQSTDISEAVLRMQNDQTLLEYTYAVTAQITSTSLIDFLR
jgi:flagellar hook-associated protein 3 FlgL